MEPTVTVIENTPSWLDNAASNLMGRFARKGELLPPGGIAVIKTKDELADFHTNAVGLGIGGAVLGYLSSLLNNPVAMTGILMGTAVSAGYITYAVKHGETELYTNSLPIPETPHPLQEQAWPDEPYINVHSDKAIVKGVSL